MPNIETIRIDLPPVALKNLPQGFRFDKTQAGWRLVENIDVQGEPNLILHSFLRPAERYENGYEIQQRAKSDAKEKGVCAGQLHMERLMEQRENIPLEWREYLLMFFGTVWRMSSTSNEDYVPIMLYKNFWNIDWRPLSQMVDRSKLLVLVG